ncbi:MAG: hypothetical protein AAGK74_02235, partial [Chloroflexota bacterium]
MQLKYHQRTYDLLTETPIDTGPYFELKEDSLYWSVRSQFADDQSARVEARRRLVALKKQRHWTNLDLFQRPVIFSQQNIEHLDNLEAKYGQKLPESVREWFSLDINPEVMGMRSFNDPFTNGLDRAEGSSDWFILWYEYYDQGGEPLLVRHSAGDDPPVYHTHPANRNITDTFSEFIYLHFWDWYAEYHCRYCFKIWNIHFIPDAIPMPDHYRVNLDHLRANFTEVNSSHLGIRYYDKHSRIWVYQPPILDEDDNIIGIEDRLTGG